MIPKRMGHNVFLLSVLLPKNRHIKLEERLSFKMTIANTAASI